MVLSFVATMIVWGKLNDRFPPTIYYAGMVLGGYGGCPEIFYDDKGQAHTSPLSGPPPLYLVPFDVLEKYTPSDEIEGVCMFAPGEITPSDALLGMPYYPISISVFLGQNNEYNLSLPEQDLQGLKLGESVRFLTIARIENDFDKSTGYIPYNPDDRLNAKFILRATNFYISPEDVEIPYQPFGISQDVQQEWVIQPKPEAAGKQTVIIDFMREGFGERHGMASMPIQNLYVVRQDGLNPFTAATFATFAVVIMGLITLFERTLSLWEQYRKVTSTNNKSSED